MITFGLQINLQRQKSTSSFLGIGCLPVPRRQFLDYSIMPSSPAKKNGETFAYIRRCGCVCTVANSRDRDWTMLPAPDLPAFVMQTNASVWIFRCRIIGYCSTDTVLLVRYHGCHISDYCSTDTVLLVLYHRCRTTGDSQIPCIPFELTCFHIQYCSPFSKCAFTIWPKLHLVYSERTVF